MLNVSSIKVEIALTPHQHDWLMALVKQGIAADMDVYFEEDRFYAEITNPNKSIIHETEPKIAPAKDPQTLNLG